MKEIARIHEIEKMINRCGAMIARLTPQAVGYNDERIYDQIYFLEEKIQYLREELATLNA